MMSRCCHGDGCCIHIISSGVRFTVVTNHHCVSFKFSPESSTPFTYISGGFIYLHIYIARSSIFSDDLNICTVAVHSYTDSGSMG